MPITMKDVRAHLELDEPDYAVAATLGPDALPYLDNLVEGKNIMLATKATYLASLIDHRSAAAVVRHAASHADPIVRVAAAAAVKNIAVEDADAVLEPLIGDGDTGVRKVAMKNIPDTPNRSLKDKIHIAAANETDPDLQSLYQDILRRIGDTTPSLTTDTGSESSLVSGERDNMGENGYASRGGGQFDDRDTALNEKDDDLGDNGYAGMGGGQLDDHDGEFSEEAHDIAESGGGDGSIDISRSAGNVTSDSDNVESSDGFGGGEW